MLGCVIALVVLQAFTTLSVLSIHSQLQKLTAGVTVVPNDARNIRG